MHSKAPCNICICSVILKQLEPLQNYKGFSPGEGGGGGTPIHYLYGDVPPNGVVILKLLI